MLLFKKAERPFLQAKNQIVIVYLTYAALTSSKYDINTPFNKHITTLF